jgi:hypothetical protein
LTSTPYAGSIAENVTGVVGITVLPGAGGIATGYAVNAVGRVTGSLSTEFTGGVIAALSKNKLMSDIKPGASMGWGILGAIANFVVNEESDRQENQLAGETRILGIKFNDEDFSNGINVIATKA